MVGGSNLNHGHPVTFHHGNSDRGLVKLVNGFQADPQPEAAVGVIC